MAKQEANSVMMAELAPVLAVKSVKSVKISKIIENENKNKIMTNEYSQLFPRSENNLNNWE